jgi:hypothetical protein
MRRGLGSKISPCCPRESELAEARPAGARAVVAYAQGWHAHPVGLPARVLADACREGDRVGLEVHGGRLKGCTGGVAGKESASPSRENEQSLRRRASFFLELRRGERLWRSRCGWILRRCRAPPRASSWAARRVTSSSLSGRTRAYQSGIGSRPCTLHEPGAEDYARIFRAHDSELLG